MQSNDIDTKIKESVKDSCLKIHSINQKLLPFIISEDIPGLFTVIKQFKEVSENLALKQAVGSLYFFLTLKLEDILRMTSEPQTFKKAIRDLVLTTAQEVLDKAAINIKEQTEQLTQKVEGLKLEEESLGKENQASLSVILSIVSNVVKEIVSLTREQEKPFSEQNK